ncbi:hypothetical protein GDO81_012080 [Engystomops pustulosus]|uniref:Uncharacterized protein n=1 Tax=Engystomops pustulosus TaxID=76066 RepID=A0AAV7BJH6_ENGPU|nr:hypothetical protein GDO81_012080 [Engystomops pustulosus]
MVAISDSTSLLPLGYLKKNCTVKIVRKTFNVKLLLSHPICLAIYSGTPPGMSLIDVCAFHIMYLTTRSSRYVTFCFGSDYFILMGGTTSPVLGMQGLWHTAGTHWGTCIIEFLLPLFIVCSYVSESEIKKNKCFFVNLLVLIFFQLFRHFLAFSKTCFEVSMGQLNFDLCLKSL